MFKLTVLGNSGPYPAQGGACSGYLLKHDNTNIVIDLGSGTLANLASALSSELECISAIILSHLHADHISDISVLRYALFRTSPTGKDGAAMQIPLYCPAAPELEYNTLKTYAQFEVNPISEQLVLGIGGLTIRFAPMVHPYPAFAVSAQSESAKFVYSGDTSWNQELVQFSEGAALLLADANLISQDRLAFKPIYHLTAEECGIAAAEAGVARLLLTHFTPGSDIGRRIAEAKAGAQKVLGRSDSLIVEEARILTSYEI